MVYTVLVAVFPSTKQWFLAQLFYVVYIFHSPTASHSHYQHIHPIIIPSCTIVILFDPCFCFVFFLLLLLMMFNECFSYIFTIVSCIGGLFFAIFFFIHLLHIRRVYFYCFNFCSRFFCIFLLFDFVLHFVVFCYSLFAVWNSYDFAYSPSPPSLSTSAFACVCVWLEDILECAHIAYMAISFVVFLLVYWLLLLSLLHIYCYLFGEFHC